MGELGLEAGDSIKTIRKRIFAITGRKLSSYDNQSNTFKVIKTFFLMMRLRGQERIFGLIGDPKSIDEARFEFRDAFPNARNTKNTWIVADLKAQLGAELATQTLDRVDRLFGDLIDRADRAREALDRAAYGRREYGKVVHAYKVLNEQISSFEVPPAKVSQASLDEELYIRLNRAEFLNYAGEHQVILNLARPPAPISPVVPELTRICFAIERKLGRRPTIHQEFLVLATFPAFAEEFSPEFRNLITAATGLEVGDDRYRSLIPLAEELLVRDHHFGTGIPAPKDEIVVSTRSIVAALCAVASQKMEGASEYRPRWFGHAYQGGSLINKLSVNVFDSTDPREYELPEGFFKLWQNRFEWVRDALCNHAEVADQKFALRQHLFAKLSDCVKVGAIDSIERTLDAFDLHVLAACAQVTDVKDPVDP